MRDDTKSRLFPIGQIVCTVGVLEATTEEERRTILLRHQIGSWEETPREDRMQNMIGLFNRLRIMSVHTAHSSGHTIWVITEADRSVTTLLLPEEY